MRFLRITTIVGGKEMKSCINPKYIVSMNELWTGDTEIILESGNRYVESGESGNRYVTSKSIFELEQEMIEMGVKE